MSFRVHCLMAAACAALAFSLPSFAATTEVASLRPVTTQQAQERSVAPKRVRSSLRRRGPSAAMLAGLRDTPDPLELSSSVAYMADEDTGEVFFEKNADVPLPIASVTKLMTALVIMESELPMNAKLKVTRADYVKCKADSQLKSGS